MTVAGACAIVLGGLVAAVTGPLGLVHGSWAAAYLVLVLGVAQYCMGRDRARRPQMRGRRPGWVQAGCWNVGGAAVIGGTVVAEPPVVDLGAVMLVVALVIALVSTLRPAGARRGGGRPPAALDRTYRVLLAVLAASIPVGLVLAHLRHS
ncbi:MAG: hypothetical protein AB7J32_26400 [Pseudonocardia sp.]